ncbi:tRNA uridine-5-carboxymethylaminomethyl(34) synthesis GTPase MnmE, partial [Thermodesulfobacteriota bacterium]
LRQKRELDKCLQAIVSAIDGFKTNTPAELIAIDLHEALSALDEIVGLTIKADILDHIFSRFCIGK